MEIYRLSLQILILWVNLYIVYTDILWRKIENRSLILLMILWWVSLFQYNLLQEPSRVYNDLIYWFFFTAVSIFLYKADRFIGAWDIKYFVCLLFFTANNIIFIQNIGILILFLLAFWFGWAIWWVTKYGKIRLLMHRLKNNHTRHFLLQEGGYWVGGGYLFLLLYREWVQFFSNFINIGIHEYLLLFIFLFIAKPILLQYFQKHKQYSFYLFFIICIYLTSSIFTNGLSYEVGTILTFIQKWLPLILVLWILSLIIQKTFTLYDELDHSEWKWEKKTFPFWLIIFMSFCLTEFFHISLPKILLGL